MYFTREGKKSMIIPFRLINNLIVIPMKVNNSGTMYFILDSGVRTPIITELFENDSLSFSFLEKQKIQGLGEGDPIEVYFSTRNDFSIYDMVHSKLNTYILTDNLFNLSARMGTKINGIIGYDVFSSFVVEIDYIREKLILHNPDMYKHKKRKRKAVLPLTIQNKKSYLNTRIEQQDGSTIPVKLLVDTGSSLAVWLSLESDERIYLPEKNQDGYLGKGLNGDIYGKHGRINAFYIGKYRLDNPTASFPDSSSVIKTVRVDGRNGSLGAEILRRFRVVIDYQNKLITFTPNNNFRDDFYYDMSGLEIIVPYPDLPIFTISKVKKGSPADLAGLKVDDQVISVNFRSGNDLSLNDINSMLQSRPGRKISMVILRGNKNMKFEFKLRRDL